MSLSAKLILVSVLVLTISAKFSEEPDHSFYVWDSSKVGTLTTVDLATDDDKVSVVSFNSVSLKFQHSVYNFDGRTVCQADYPFNLAYVGWPSQTNGLFFDAMNKSLLKASSPCASPDYLTAVPDAIEGVSFTYTSKESYIAFAFKTNRIVQYNLGSGASKEFNIDNATEILGGVDYSPNHDYLYAATLSNDKLKAIIYDAESGDRKKQVFAELSFIKGNADGDGFLAGDQQTNILYNVDKDGNKKQIWAPLPSNDTIEAPLAICTDDIKIVALKISGIETNPSVEVISYDSDDGSVSQSFNLDFVPVIKYTYCNDNYLSMVDTTGKVHLFKYSHSLPVWAIILIVVGSLLIIGGIVGFIIYKRKQGKKAEEYQQFNNEEKSRNGL